MEREIQFDGGEFSRMVSNACQEIEGCVRGVDVGALEKLVQWICDSERIVLYGVGREGLAMRGFCMRLFHLGKDVHVVGDMTTPPLNDAQRDLLLVSAGPGHFGTVESLVRSVSAHNVKTVCFTAQPDAAIPKLAALVVHVPASTMAGKARPGPGGNTDSVLLMGSAYEGALFVLFEIVVELCRRRLEVAKDEMTFRHTNLE